MRPPLVPGLHLQANRPYTGYAYLRARGGAIAATVSLHHWLLDASLAEASLGFFARGFVLLGVFLGFFLSLFTRQQLLNCIAALRLSVWARQINLAAHLLYASR